MRDTDEGPELWAVDVEWCLEARAGIESRPPLWRYFSPAYSVDPGTGEITGYVNLALCINPRTFNAQELAAWSAGSRPGASSTSAKRERAAMISWLDAPAHARGAAFNDLCAAAMGAPFPTTKERTMPTDSSPKKHAATTEREDASEHVAAWLDALSELPALSYAERTTINAARALLEKYPPGDLHDEDDDASATDATRAGALKKASVEADLDRVLPVQRAGNALVSKEDGRLTFHTPTAGQLASLRSRGGRR